MAKAWLQQRWELLFPVLAELTVDQEEQVAQVCAEEIAAWKSRPSMKSFSSLKEPMTDTRNEIRAKLPLTEHTSYMNPRTATREHIALKYLNYSEAEWAEMNKQSNDRFHERLEHQQLLDHPDALVAKATELLSRTSWPDIVVGLAVSTGRRLSEILKVGELFPKTLYTVVFSGQLKRKDEVLPPYEIPVLCGAPLVLSAWQTLRGMIDCTQMETEAISKAYSAELTDVAERHFSDLVPHRDGRDQLFTHLFRAVYPRLAVYYFCPTTVADIAYVSTILGHYWSTKGDAAQQRNYVSSLHYFDYKVGDGSGNIDGRQGIRLGEPGVQVIEAFRPKPVTAGTHQKKEHHVMDILRLDKKKDHSITRMAQETKSRIDQVQKELGSRTQDEALSSMIDEHYVLQQMVQLLFPLYEQLGANNPVSAVQALLGAGGAVQVDQHLGEQFHTSLAEVTTLLGDAANESEEPVVYLRTLLSAKRDFKKSYEKRHIGKDYSKMALSELRRTKTPEAAAERFKRATDAIMAYNEKTDIPELRWYINAAVVVDLVGGRPSDVKDYLETRREEIDAHHKKHVLTPGYNRRPISITERITVPEGGVVEEEPVIQE